MMRGSFLGAGMSHRHAEMRRISHSGHTATAADVSNCCPIEGKGGNALKLAKEPPLASSEHHYNSQHALS